MSNKKGIKTQDIKVTDAEAGKMFTYWVNNNRNFAATGRKFKRATTTVRRTATRFEWIDRADNIKKTIQKNLDNQIAKKEYSNLEVVRAMKNKVAASVLERLKNKTYKPTIYDYIALLKYEDGFTGGVQEPDNVNNQTINNNVINLISVISNYNEKELDKLDKNLAAILAGTGTGSRFSDN